MGQRGQATVEYAGIALLVLVLVFGGVRAAQARLGQAPTSDASFLELAARHTPALVLERGDDSLPVDFRSCRSRSCAGRSPVLFLHAVRRNGFVYLEYWEYLPDSRTASTGIDMLDGAHADDWEGVIATRMTTGFPPCLVPHWLQAPKTRGVALPGRPALATNDRRCRS